MKTYTCSCTGTKTESIDALGHDRVQHEAQKATCTKIGWEAYETCSRCDYTTYKETIALGHTGGTATCTEKAVCTRCKNAYGSPLGHNWIKTEEKAPTCTATGWTAYEQCSRCECYKDEYQGEKISALGHDWKDNSCSRCGVKTSEGLKYALSNDGTYYSVIGIGTCTDTDITIPSTYKNLPVTAIGSSAFKNCSSLTSVAIPDSVTHIDERAFLWCSSLTSVTIGDSVTSIGEDAFSSCSSLTSVYYNGTIDGWVQISFNYAANPLHYAKKLYINNKLVTKANITTATKISDYAFYGCSSLTSVVIPDSVTSIGENAFYDCSSLTRVVIPDSVTEIGGNAFLHCSSLTSVVIPDSVTSIGDYAFYGCSSLTSVTIGNGVTSIGYEAFSYCSSLTSVVIPDSVTVIGYGAFSGWSSLTSIEVSKNNTAYKSIDGNVYTKDETTLIQYAIGKTAKSFTIPDSVTSIGEGAFSYCSSLTSVVIPDGVTSIGYQAFYWCSSLTSVVIPDSVTSIGYGAFRDCSNLTSVVIPDSVTSIGNYAFWECSKLQYNEYDNAKYLGNENNPYFALITATSYDITSCTIHNNTKVIADHAFYWLDSLTSVTIGNGVTSIGEDAFKYCSSLTSVVLPDGVTSIGSSAFEGCSSLTSVTIGNGVTSIGSSAFKNCRSLTSVEIPDSVTSIGSYAFFYCSSLKSVTIGNGVTYIGEYAFYWLDSLTSVTIGNGVTSIGEYAFYECSSLTSITFNGTKAQWNAIKKGSYWKSNSAIKTVVCTDGSVSV